MRCDQSASLISLNLRLYFCQSATFPRMFTYGKACEWISARRDASLGFEEGKYSLEQAFTDPDYQGKTNSGSS